MSRSYKKPYHSTTCSGARPGIMKSWKKQNDKSLRHKEIEENLPPSYYKKLNDAWSAPNDGKIYNPDYKKAHRK